VEVSIGKELYSGWIWAGTLTCVESITITVHASDGRVSSSEVPVALEPGADTEHVLVTREARKQLSASEIWYHFGGWCDDGDTYDTEAAQFESELDHFWANVTGPDEYLRQNIVNPLSTIKSKWTAVHAYPTGRVLIEYENGSTETLTPPG
jgi:hypothetical protein